MLRQLCEAGDFFRRVRTQLRFGDLSREPLSLVRVQVQADWVECDWLARRPDAWDAAISSSARDHNHAMQALGDAMRVRDLLFSIFPDSSTATIRAYRRGDPPELIIAGTCLRTERALRGVRSLAMRAKLCGLQFRLEDGRLEPLQRNALLALIPGDFPALAGRV